MAAACSGLRSLFALGMVSLLYGYLSLEKGWHRFLLAAAAVPFAVIGNFVRMILLYVGTITLGKEVAIGKDHFNPSGYPYRCGDRGLHCGPGLHDDPGHCSPGVASRPSGGGRRGCDKWRRQERWLKWLTLTNSKTEPLICDDDTSIDLENCSRAGSCGSDGRAVRGISQCGDRSGDRDGDAAAGSYSRLRNLRTSGE